MKSIVKFITEARGSSAIMTTINEWIDMSRKPHDTKLYCVIGRDDESLDGYIICVNIESTPYQIDAFYLTESQLKQLYKSATNNTYRKFSFFNVGGYISIYMGADLIVNKPTNRLDIDEADDDTIKKFMSIYQESKYTIPSKRVSNILAKLFNKLVNK